MNFTIESFEREHIEEVFALWRASEGLGLAGESAERIEDCLLRSPGLSFVAMRDGRIAGAVLCTSDGRRGYLHHLAVARQDRRSGIGRALAMAAASAAARQGLPKVHLFVLRTNAEALAFWARIGWVERTDLAMMTRSFEPTPDPDEWTTISGGQVTP